MALSSPNTSLCDLITTNNNHIWAGVCVILLVALLLHIYGKKNAIYLLDYTCYKPPYSCRAPMSLYAEYIELDDEFDDDAVAFQIKVLEKSGFSDETSIAPSLFRVPITKSLSFDRDEAKMVLFSLVKELLDKSSMRPKAIDILIINSCMFSTTPSLTAMVVNEFKMRSNIMSFNLSGMGCSAGIISIGLARDLLKVHRNSLALILSTEFMSMNWYTGKNRSMLLSNCLFRMGGAAILMSSRSQDRKKSKYSLQHVVRTNIARDDESYPCICQEEDDKKKTGISISRNILTVAGEAMKANLAMLGPKVLPFSQQFRYVMFLVLQKMRILDKTRVYIPDFRQAFEHFCIHTGGKAVILAIEKRLRLRSEDMEASKMTLYRFGNTSSSSIWYELSYMEAKGRIRKGDRVWQLAFGSGFKCNSAVWKCVASIVTDQGNPWSDRIQTYPVDVPDTRKIF
ncbi:putative 3-ketoacyl-CoA synthase 20 [Dorcoceras hygrometricum]|uniref:3-ketoacyl-CoA synthase n=1 Tax=Dorcoceras hygrometricum TaxID=472368 RepID=A0A2Z7BCK3_9LAMI|nr:putative 3-ketoacyl-CoA synthase 20 [Dorcoceras hygrometricum]